MQDDDRTHRRAGNARRGEVVADRVDEPPLFGETQKDKTEEGDQGEKQDRGRRAPKETAADPGDDIGARRQVDDVEWDQRPANEAVDQRRHSESGEERGDLDVSDQNAVDDADRQRQQKSKQQRRRDRNAQRSEVEGPGGGHRVGRHDRQIDPASDDDDRHSHAQDAQSGDAAHQGDHIAGAEKTLEKDGKEAKQSGGGQEHDPLLTDQRAPYLSEHRSTRLSLPPWSACATRAAFCLRPTIPSCFRFRLRGSARFLHPSAKTGQKWAIAPRGSRASPLRPRAVLPFQGAERYA